MKRTGLAASAWRGAAVLWLLRAGAVLWRRSVDFADKSCGEASSDRKKRTGAEFSGAGSELVKKASNRERELFCVGGIGAGDSAEDKNVSNCIAAQPIAGVNSSGDFASGV